MNFRSRVFHNQTSAQTEPEINLIPFIDVLLVVLIFLMLTTTYSKFAELQLKLPVADAQPSSTRMHEILVGVNASGAYSIDKQALQTRDLNTLTTALRQAANVNANKVEPTIIISADAQASHQAVISVMEAARLAGLSQITFATEKAK